MEKENKEEKEEEEEDKYEYDEEYIIDSTYKGPVYESQPYSGGVFITPPGWKKLTIKRKISDPEGLPSKKLFVDDDNDDV